LANNILSTNVLSKIIFVKIPVCQLTVHLIIFSSKFHLFVKPTAFMYFHAPGPNFFTSGLFEVKIRVASWVSPACGTQKEVVVMTVVLTAHRRR
jgi:hypothetical protein